MIARRALGLALAAASLLAASCAGGSPEGSGGDPDAVLLRVTTTGGLLPPEFSLTFLPSFSLMGDGLVILEGPQDASFPGPAMPNVLQRRLTGAGISTVVAEAKRAGLDGPDHIYAAPGVADAGTTTFTFRQAGRTHVIAVEALGLAISGPDREARDRLNAFNQKLATPEQWLPAGAAGAQGPYVPIAMRLFAGPYDPKGFPDGTAQTPVDWPLSKPLGAFGAPFDGGLRCGVVSGPDLTTLLPSIKKVSEATPWRSDATLYRLLVRPLLPDESGC